MIFSAGNPKGQAASVVFFPPPRTPLPRKLRLVL